MAIAGAGAIVGAGALAGAPRAEAKLALPRLPYAPGALEPYISARTIGFHHGKHHAAYVANTNRIARAMGLSRKSLTELVMISGRDPKKKALFNNAAQAWNHAFYWQSMKPGGGGAPQGKLAQRIKAAFGSIEAFKKTFAVAAAGQFGSGWAWLVLDGGKLKVRATANADTPLTQGQRPLLTIDVWEHAYYLDYQNRRADYIKSFLDRLVNWDFAARNLSGS
ncbi:MAG: superoxide dismutase [Proteobacteria bacterium]|nr:superoxide dismutase [Pseudomonadota bacterium]MBU1742985.1 superoxide dismutase [Pseudomonadota bacterium]